VEPDRIDIIRELAEALLRLERVDDARTVLAEFVRDHPMQAPELEADPASRPAEQLAARAVAGPCHPLISVLFGTL